MKTFRDDLGTPRTLLILALTNEFFMVLRVGARSQWLKGLYQIVYTLSVKRRAGLNRGTMSS